MVEALLELKKMEWEEYESQTTREHMISTEVRWGRIAKSLKEKNCATYASQCHGKWEVVVGGYRKIKDHNNRSGNAPFSSLSKIERKDSKLPLEFSDKWIEILDFFYRQRANISPPCMAKSGDIGVGSPGIAEITVDVEPVREEASAVERGHTFGNERIVREVEEKRHQRESKKLKWLEEQAVSNKRWQEEIENRQNDRMRVLMTMSTTLLCIQLALERANLVPSFNSLTTEDIHMEDAEVETDPILMWALAIQLASIVVASFAF
ncbi:hypothetical protein R1flu_019127 [Riccia fluitans]|uniref:Myb-like domain-containing protein n=1 Tax=Riccia fluitans TaxID=41844 RepID=A0ABD1ZHT0_9MARC